VPDEDARVQEVRYINPKKAEWPETDYIVGNPPFIGSQFVRETLGIGYAEALRQVYRNDISDSSDYVMYWWNTAAKLVSDRRARRFGLITTNSLHQHYNRRVVQKNLDSSDELRLLFAVPDHPWVDAPGGAAVRISMTVAGNDKATGQLLRVTKETKSENDGRTVEFEEQVGLIDASLRIGADLNSAMPLQSNDDLCYMGVKLVGQGFVLDERELEAFGSNRELIRQFRNGRDLTSTCRNVSVIDTFGISEQNLRSNHPQVFQHLFNKVKPGRDAKRGKSKDSTEYAERWWQHAKPRPEMRRALQGLPCFLATSEVAKHRFFVVLDAEVLADGALIAIAVDSLFVLGVLSSRTHVCWTLHSGGRLESRPRYTTARCFDPFPFPDPDDATKKRIGDLAEQLDAHRKRQQEQHPKLTMTGMYNVLEKLRAGETLTAKDKTIHEQGIVSVLKQIHDDLDAAVFDAYGWPHDLDDEAILQRLVDLNHERADEESIGMVRWLRPDFQNPDGATQTAFAGDDKAKRTKKAATTKVKKQPWPKTLPDRMVAIQSALQQHAAPADAKEVAAYYTRANKSQVTELLETLAAVGNVRQLDDGRFTVFK
ncbi:MAG: type IIL restriction-modification enzyme MmeI, partial [Rhodopirellula sp. JB053]